MTELPRIPPSPSTRPIQPSRKVDREPKRAPSGRQRPPKKERKPASSDETGQDETTDPGEAPSIDIRV